MEPGRDLGDIRCGSLQHQQCLLPMVGPGAGSRGLWFCRWASVSPAWPSPGTVALIAPGWPVCCSSSIQDRGRYDDSMAPGDGTECDRADFQTWPSRWLASGQVGKPGHRLHPPGSSWISFQCWEVGLESPGPAGCSRPRPVQLHPAGRAHPPQGRPGRGRGFTDAVSVAHCCVEAASRRGVCGDLQRPCLRGFAGEGRARNAPASRGGWISATGMGLSPCVGSSAGV